ncbi:MAG: TonB-dependent receptor [Bacteroidales bacterium]|jgi:iron complex outermembrane receptor protein|nr:TonB-dependent receptor [Bacteroidales bacterium]
MNKNITKQQYHFCFNRWTRASYAMFNSLHKVVKIGVLSLSCSFLSLCSPSLFGQVAHDTTGNKTIILEEMIVGESKTSVFIAPQQITSVITRSEIEHAGVETLQDLLLYVQGVDLRTRGSNGIQADVSLRGGTFDQTMVLLNGINLTDPQTGHFSLNIPVHVEAIERIEVLEGIGSMAYNTVAFAGCINIITRSPEENIFDLSIGSGMYGFIRAAANSHFRIKKFYLTAGGNINRSEGYDHNTDYIHGNLFFRMLYKDKKKGVFELQGGFQEKEYGANSFYSAKYKDQYEHLRVFFTSINYNLIINQWRINANAYFRKNYDQFKLFRYEVPSWYTNHNYHETELEGVNLQTAYNYKWGNTAIGIDFKRENILSNNLGTSLSRFIPVFLKSDTSFYDKGAHREHIGVQIQQNFHLNNFKMSLGARGNWNPDFGFNWNIGTNGILFLPHKVEINYFVQNVYRLPNFTDLFYSGAAQTGNPNLQPEQAIVAELSLTWKPKQWNLNLTTFYRYGFRIIDWVRLSLEENWFCENLTNVQATGIDVSARFIPKKGYLSLIGIQYNYLFVSKNSKGYLSLYATDYLRNQIKFNLHHKIYWKLYANWQFNFQERMGTYLDNTTNTEQDYKPYLLCNLKISLLLKQTQIFIEASNLFNTVYFDLGNISQPGIWIKGGISVNLLQGTSKN